MSTVFQQVGRYAIQRELGRGGMATVFLAADPATGMDVALKQVAVGFDRDGHEILEAEQWGAELQSHFSEICDAVPKVYDSWQDGDYFYIGGEPDNATSNIYKISVSSPKVHSFLNRQDKVGHRIFTIDYTKTIEIDGQAKVTFHGDGQNGRLISNFAKLTVPDVSPEIKQPYHGQFVQVDVVSVEEAK